MIRRLYDVFRDKHGIPHKKIAPGNVVFRRFVYDDRTGTPIHAIGAENGGCCSWILPTLGLDGVE